MMDAVSNTGERPRVRIALMFHSFTSGNLGVGALTVANMAIAECVAREEGLEPEFVAVGVRDGDTAPIGGGRIPTVVVERRALYGRKGLWDVFGRVDCALSINAGDSFTSIYGFRRLFFIGATTLIALARRVPTVFSPQTIGPFDTPRSRRFAGFLMRRMRAVVARDNKSLAHVRELAPDANALLAVDVAFELPFENRSAQRGGARLKVGINASGLLFTDAESGRNRFGLGIDYARYTRALIAALLARDDVEVHLVTHAYSKGMPEDDDTRRAELLAAEFPRAIRVPDFTHPSDVKSYISALDFLVAGRMHACIGAFSAGTPVLPVAYSRKFDGLFGMLGYKWLLPVTGMDTEEALAFTLDAINRRAELAADEAAGMAKVAGLLDVYRDVLRDLFRDLKPRLARRAARA